MLSTRENLCHRFQANIFNRSKCKNCFKTRDTHVFSEPDIYQAKPVHAGWLLLAPEGISLSNPAQKTRRWQRRFFVLYEHGVLQYFLDDMPGTLPQGTVDMTQCSEVLEASSQTGFSRSLCLRCRDQDYYIRTESTDLNRWQESLLAHSKATKPNQWRRRKESAPTKPCPAKQNVTSERDQTSNPSSSSSSSSSTISNSSSSISSSAHKSSICRVTTVSVTGVSGYAKSNVNSDSRTSKVNRSLSSSGSSKGNSSTRANSNSIQSKGSVGTSASTARVGSVCAAVEAVPLLASRRSSEEAQPPVCVEVIPCSHSSAPPSCSSLTSSLRLPSRDPSMQGCKSRAGVESGYSSLEKTQADAPPTQAPPLSISSPDSEYRCESTLVSPPPSPPRLILPRSNSNCPSNFQQPNHNPTESSRLCEVGVVNGMWAGQRAETVPDISTTPLQSGMIHPPTTHTHAPHTHTLRTGSSTSHRTSSPGREEVHRLFGKQRRRSQVIEQFEKDRVNFTQTTEPSSSSSSSSSSTMSLSKTAQMSATEESADVPHSFVSCRQRSKSLDQRSTEPAPTPDLLNFKKGWMTRLGEDGKWRKHWFVLTDRSLRFYRDPVAEEAADLDGEINLSTCYNITDVSVPRNYGFQIQTKDGIFTLCAMTSGMRRNWIQAVRKNCPPIAPDVTRSIPQPVSLKAALGLRGDAQSETQPREEEKRSRIRGRRQEGRYKTFDWAEFSHHQQEESKSKSQREQAWDPLLSCLSAPADPFEPMRESVTEGVGPEKVTLQETLQHLQTPTPSMPVSPLPLVTATRTHPARDAAPSDDDRQISSSTSSSPASSSPSTSSSVQTEPGQEDDELRSLRCELERERERSQRQEEQFKANQSRLQAELSDSQKCLSEVESGLSKTESRLKGREELLKELQERLVTVSGQLKATEEAQAQKEAYIQRHLRLLQESQERERRSLGDSLAHAEQRGSQLEARVQELEAEQQEQCRRLGGGAAATEELERRCQELQNQLEESDAEVSRLQNRLQTEETLYYDMEHEYERACEELENLRGALRDCERACAERHASHIDRKQQLLDRKEQELQEVLVKMAALGNSLEETERRLKEAQERPEGSSTSCDGSQEAQGLFDASDVRQSLKSMVTMETLPVAQGEGSERVISVIQALENKLFDTEEKLREITERLLQHQQLTADTHIPHHADTHIPHHADTHTPPHADTHTLCRPPSWGANGPFYLNEATGGNLLHADLEGCNQPLPDEHNPTKMGTANTSAYANADTNANAGFNASFGADANVTSGTKPLGSSVSAAENHFSMGVSSQALYLTALVLERMAAALEAPSAELWRCLHALDAQALSLSQGAVSRSSSYGRLLAHLPDLNEPSGVGEDVLSESAICRLCVRAELAFLTHARPSDQDAVMREAEWADSLLWAVPGALSEGARGGATSMKSPELADISPPELAPYVEQIHEGLEEELRQEDTGAPQHSGREGLVAELRAEAHSLQRLSEATAATTGGVPPPTLQEALWQAVLAFVACRQRFALRQEVQAAREQQERAACECRAICRSMEALFQEQAERYEARLRQECVTTETVEKARDRAEEEARRLEAELEEKLSELQRIHEEEMGRLHSYYMQNTSPSRGTVTSDQSSVGEVEPATVAMLNEQVRELEAELCSMKELASREANAQREKSQQDLDNLKAMCEQGFSSMEQTHQRITEELQRQHQREVERLTAERERVLQEETDATIAAIEAMRKAHKEELEKTVRTQLGGASTDTTLLRTQSDEELQALHRELEVLSEQYSQRCLDISRLSRTLETDRQALAMSNRHNQELHTHNQELKKQLATEVALMRSCLKGELGDSSSSQERNLYQLEVTLRMKNAEIQYLKREISLLKVELRTEEKCPTVLSSEHSGKATKPHRVEQQDYKCDLIKSRSNPDFQKDRSSRARHLRSKSLKDGLSVQERMKLFESLDSRKI